MNAVEQALSDTEASARLTEMTKPEPLHPDLRRYVTKTTKVGWPFLNHPLVQSLPYDERFNAVLNRSYEHKQRNLAKAVATKDWEQCIWLHERPYRVMAYISALALGLDSPERWHIMKMTWIDSEFPHTSLRFWRKEWENAPPAVMTADEQDYLAKLPDELTLWRGTSVAEANPLAKRHSFGISWTLYQDRARFFARRFNEQPMLLSAVVPKALVKAYLNERQESECVVPRMPERFVNMLPVAKYKQPLLNNAPAQ